MKTKVQKIADVKAAGELASKSKTLLFADFGTITAENLRQLRRIVSEAGGEMKIVKKRLMNVLFKEKGIDYDLRQFDGPVGTIFAEEGLDKIGAPVLKFFQGLGADNKSREASVKKILGAYDLAAGASVSRETVMAIAMLPPREVLLAQLLGQLLAPLQAFMYILQQKAAQGPEAPAAAEPAAEEVKAEEPKVEAEAAAEPAAEEAKTEEAPAEAAPEAAPEESAQ
jgi:large subunit ribosomal protein L10